MSFRPLVLALVAISLGACSPEDSEPVDGSDASPVARPDDAADVAGKEAETVTALTCDYPVRGSDTADSLRKRYGDDAQVDMLAGPEGTEIPGLLLWSDDMARAVEVGFASEERDRVAFVRVFAGSTWTVEGLAVEDSLERMVDINGAPVTFRGFGWDYGGTVTDFGAGKLAQRADCDIFIILDSPPEDVQLPMRLMGEGEISSESDDVPAGSITVGEIGLSYL